MSYRFLEWSELDRTIRLLHDRIEERIPGASLARVCDELLGLSAEARTSVDKIRRPIVPLRVATGLLVAVIVGGIMTIGYRFGSPGEPMSLPYFVQILEAAINDVVLIGIGIFFLASVEKRLKRKRVLRAMHALRSVTHIIDMLQLTKDPGTGSGAVGSTRSSPVRDLSSADLARYLDYCSELLSLTGKVASMYAQHFDDDMALAAVREIEQLATDLSAKIWQKLLVLEMASLSRDRSGTHLSRR